MNFAHRLIVCVALLGFANAQAQTLGTHSVPSPQEAQSSERTLSELIKPLGSEDFKVRLDAFNILKKPEFAESVTSWALKCVPPQNSECSKRQREMDFDLLDAHAKYVWSNSGPKFLDELLSALKEDKEFSTKFPVMRLLKKGYASQHAELISARVHARLDSAPLPQAEPRSRGSFRGGGLV
jgi:hypothetical protein